MCFQTYHNHSHGSPVPVWRDPSYSKRRPECPPRVCFTPDMDASMFTLHILSDTAGGYHPLKYLLLMDRVKLEMHSEDVIEWDWRCSWRPWLFKFGGHNWTSLDIHVEAASEWWWRCTSRPWSSELVDSLGAHDPASLGMHSEAEIEWAQQYAWRL